MKLKLTLKRGSGLEADIAVTADASATVGDVAAAISALDPYRSTASIDDGARVSLHVIEPGTGTQRVLDVDAPIAEAPVASGATIALGRLGAPGVGVPQRETPVAQLTVLEGADVGRKFPLAVGTSFLGRDAANADLVLNDPLVSKRHARVEVSASSVRVVDLNSANGLEVDGGIVTRVELENGATVRVGDSLLRADILLKPSPTNPGHLHEVKVAQGPIAFNRSPRVESRYPGREYPAPAMPAQRDQQPFPWVAVVIPLILGVVLFIAMHRQPASVLYVLAAPVLMAGSYFGNRATLKRKEKLDVARFEARATTLETALEAERDRERTVRIQENPSTHEVYEAGMRLGPLLWTRRPEHWQFLSLNLGRGRMLSRNTVTISNEDSALPVYLDRVLAAQDKYRFIDDVPVVENLYFSGAIGIAGSHGETADIARSIVVQAVGLHSPSELVIAALVSNAWTSEFEWLKWLPHTGSQHSPLEVAHLANSEATGNALLSALEDLVATRTRSAQEPRGAVMLQSSALVAGASAGEGADVATPPPSAVPAVLLVISDDAPVDRARLVQLAERAADAGIYPVWVAASVPDLPAVARTFVRADTENETTEVGLVRL
ncbi:MAG: FHA domain-containing protein, partial [Lacisediminihabitans sp.]